MDKEPTPLGWVSNAIEDSSDSATKIVPILQANPLGAILFMALLTTASVCIAMILIAWKDPDPIKRLTQPIPVIRSAHQK